MLPWVISVFTWLATDLPVAAIDLAQPVAAAPDDEAQRFADRLKSVDEAMAGVQDLRADFEQRRHTPLLKKPLVSKGVVRCKGDLVRWDTASPRPSSLLIGEGSIQMYYPQDKLVEVYPVGEGFRDLAGAPLPRFSVLRARFDITRLAPKDLGGRDEDPKLLAIELTPRSPDLRRHVASVKVLIDESRSAATKVVMVDPDGEKTEIVFSNVVINGGLTREQVQLKLPEDVRISRPMGDTETEKSGVGTPSGKQMPR